MPAPQLVVMPRVIHQCLLALKDVMDTVDQQLNAEVSAFYSQLQRSVLAQFEQDADKLLLVFNRT